MSSFNFAQVPAPKKVPKKMPMPLAAETAQTEVAQVQVAQVQVAQAQLAQQQATEAAQAQLAQQQSAQLSENRTLQFAAKAEHFLTSDLRRMVENFGLDKTMLLARLENGGHRATYMITEMKTHKKASAESRASANKLPELKDGSEVNLALQKEIMKSWSSEDHAASKKRYNRFIDTALKKVFAEKESAAQQRLDEELALRDRHSAVCSEAFGTLAVLSKKAKADQTQLADSDLLMKEQEHFFEVKKAEMERLIADMQKTKTDNALKRKICEVSDQTFTYATTVTKKLCESDFNVNPDIMFAHFTHLVKSGDDKISALMHVEVPVIEVAVQAVQVVVAESAVQMVVAEEEPDTSEETVNAEGDEHVH
jgi:hypothetical protein